MASLIDCPHCGSRPKEEFTVKGAAIERPAADAPAARWLDYVYMRENAFGLHREYWHHTSGCRRWLVVERNTMTHEVKSVVDAASAATPGAAE